jgi:hypothetical protein
MTKDPRTYRQDHEVWTNTLLVGVLYWTATSDVLQKTYVHIFSTLLIRMRAGSTEYDFRKRGIHPVTYGVPAGSLLPQQLKATSTASIDR